MSAHHNHGHGELSVFRPFFEQGNAVAIGHPNIQQHKGGAVFVSHGTRFAGIGSQRNGVAFIFKSFLQYFANSNFVIDDQDVCTSHEFSASVVVILGSVMLMLAPDGIWLAMLMCPPCSSMIFLTTGKPSPVPAGLSVT